MTTKATDPLAVLSQGISAQSVYAPEYGVELAIDGSPDPYQAWISRPYGGGTTDAPQDVWWQIELGPEQGSHAAGREDRRRPSRRDSAPENSPGAGP